MHPSRLLEEGHTNYILELPTIPFPVMGFSVMEFLLGVFESLMTTHIIHGKQMQRTCTTSEPWARVLEPPIPFRVMMLTAMELLLWVIESLMITHVKTNAKNMCI